MAPTAPLLGLAGAGALGLAWLMHAEQLPRNGIVGMRTGATMSSDAAWAAAHHASAWSLAAVGVICLAAAIWLVRTRRPASAHAAVLMGTGIAAVVVIIIGGIHADRVAQDLARASSG